MMPSRLRSLFALTALSSFAAACGSTAGSDSTSDEAAQIQQALDQENGGFDESDELPSFGDEGLVDGPELGDAFAESPEMLPPPVPGMVPRRVALLWGNLPMAPQDPATLEPADWSGTISVDAGAIGVRRTVKFEDDDAIAPRTSPQIVELSSHTLPHVDGLLLDVMAPPDAVLHFETVAIALDLPLADLDLVNGGVTMLEDGVNGVAYAAHPVMPECPEGFLIGHWKSIEEGAGHFGGRVMNDDGDVIGHMRGIYGHAPESDEQRFFGKYIAGDGAYRGRFGGRYGDGHFEGRWKSIAGPDRHGMLVGRYFDGLAAGDGEGLYVGRWAERCGCNGEPPPEPLPPGEGEGAPPPPPAEPPAE